MMQIIVTKPGLGLTVGKQYEVIEYYPNSNSVTIHDDDGWSHGLSKRYWKRAPQQHCYIVECEKPDSTGAGIRYITDIEVSATNRDQAARMIEKQGYTVRSVNMMG